HWCSIRCLDGIWKSKKTCFCFVNVSSPRLSPAPDQSSTSRYQINPSRSSGLSCRTHPCLLVPFPPGPCRSHHHDHLRTGREGLLNGLLYIGRKDDDSVVILDALEKM